MIDRLPAVLRIIAWRLRYVIAITGAMLSGTIGLAAYVTRRINAPGKSDRSDFFSFTPWELQIPHEGVEFPADGNITLRGWWFPREGTRRVIVGCTGFRGRKQDLLGIGSGLWRAGNTVLLFDYRGCGESDWAPQSLAHKELPDVRAAVRFARQRRPDASLGLVGYSMGAALAILVAAEDPSIQAVVADSSFASIWDVIAHAFRQRGMPVRPLIDLASAYNQQRYGYSFSSIRPVDAVARIAPRPLLLIHGEKDSTTPVDHAYRLAAAAQEPKELWIANGAEHCGAYFSDRSGYVDRVARFFGNALEGKGNEVGARPGNA